MDPHNGNVALKRTDGQQHGTGSSSGHSNNAQDLSAQAYNTTSADLAACFGVNNQPHELPKQATARQMPMGLNGFLAPLSKSALECCPSVHPVFDPMPIDSTPLSRVEIGWAEPASTAHREGSPADLSSPSDTHSVAPHEDTARLRQPGISVKGPSRFMHIPRSLEDNAAWSVHFKRSKSKNAIGRGIEDEVNKILQHNSILWQDWVNIPKSKTMSDMTLRLHTSLRNIVTLDNENLVEKANFQMYRASVDDVDRLFCYINLQDKVGTQISKYATVSWQAMFSIATTLPDVDQRTVPHEVESALCKAVMDTALRDGMTRMLRDVNADFSYEAWSSLQRKDKHLNWAKSILLHEVRKKLQSLDLSRPNTTWSILDTHWSFVKEAASTSMSERHTDNQLAGRLIATVPCNRDLPETILASRKIHFDNQDMSTEAHQQADIDNEQG